MILDHLTGICTIVLLIIFPSICSPIHTPPRSPSPVSLEPLLFHDDWNPFEELIRVEHAVPQSMSSQGSSPQRVHPDLTKSDHAVTVNSEVSNVPQTTKSGKIMIPRLKSTLSVVNQSRKRGRGRIAYLTVEQKRANASERSRQWKKKKLKSDPDYLARQARRLRHNKSISLGLPIRKVGRPPKKQDAPNPSNI